MVRGIFCHDLPIYKDINGVYCCTTLTDDVFRRYFRVVDELIVATRVYKLECTFNEAHQERITLPNIRFLEFPNLNKPQYVFTALPKAQKRLEEAMEEVDLIFIRGGILALLGAKAARNLGKPYLMESAGCAWNDYWNHSLYGKIIAPYMEYSFRKITRDAKFVVYVTEKWLQKRYPTNGISDGVSDVILTRIDDSALDKRIAKIRGRKPGDPWIIGTTAGVNNKIKGQQFVIEAMAELGDRYNIRYELVGTGSTEYLRSIAKKYHVEDRVIFKGETTHEEVLSWLDSIDTYIQPSMTEGLPRALIEAMSRACPVIGSTAGGIPELLESEVIFERGKVSKLISIMTSFYESDWIKHSIINHKKAKEFQMDILDERRGRVFDQYRDYVLLGGDV